jgi:hypothetical protein
MMLFDSLVLHYFFYSYSLSAFAHGAGWLSFLFTLLCGRAYYKYNYLQIIFSPVWLVTKKIMLFMICKTFFVLENIKKLG